MIIRYCFLLMLTSVLVLAPGCGGGGGGSNPGLSAKAQVVDALTAGVMIPHITAFAEQTTTFNQAMSSFLSTLSLETLTNVQNEWRQSQIAWQKTAAYQFGPVSDQRFLNQINFWPKQVNIITDILNAPGELTADEFAGFGSTRKGLPVLEFLLFSQSLSNTEILAEFTNNTRRRQYAQFLSQDIMTLADRVETAWRSDGGQYGEMLVESASGLNIIINQIVLALETAKNKKVGSTSGLRDGGSADPSKVESQESETSLSHIQQNVVSVKDVFRGIRSGEEGHGIDDFLVAEGHQDLKDQINTQLTAVEVAIADISLPLWQAVTSEAAKVDALHTELTELLRLFKIDMANAINETIFFNDSDGDS